MTEREKIAHLLRRFGLGASEAELDFYEPMGLRGAVDFLLESDGRPEPFDPDPQEFQNKQRVVNMRVVQGLWYGRLLWTERPLVEKMTIFWHDHFATSAAKVDSSYAMLRHIDTLRVHSLGKFEDLLVSVSQDPAMLYWLDNNQNVAGRPNENFAREVMELFTLSIGHYTEKDVQEAARAFTGWGYGRGTVSSEQSRAPRRVERFVADARKHDAGEKTVLGKSGAFGGQDVLRLLCEQPQTARYIATKVWKYFGCDTPPGTAVNRSTQAFSRSGLDIKELLRSVMLADEFYSDAVVRRLVKSPIDFVVPTARQLGVGQTMRARIEEGIANPQINEENGLNQGLVRAMAPAFAVGQGTKNMGMELLYPPDVDGWVSGTGWISTATMVARAKWSESLFPGGRPQGQAAPGARAPAAPANAFPILQADPTPTGVADRLCSLFDVRPTASARNMLIEAASAAMGGRLTQANANAVARGAMRLVCAMPEFQMA